jgi:hypothetical protein
MVAAGAGALRAGKKLKTATIKIIIADIPTAMIGPKYRIRYSFHDQKVGNYGLSVISGHEKIVNQL